MTFFGSADYAASKHGGIGLTQHLAWELADSNITVNAICPGATLTPLAEQGTTPEYREMVRKRLIPLGHWCTPDDIAGAVIYFASDRANMVTGQVLDVDGGSMTGYGEGIVCSQIIGPNCHPPAKTHHRSSHKTTIDRGQVCPKCGHGTRTLPLYPRYPCRIG